MRTMTALALAVVVGAAAFFTPSASAADFGISVGVPGPVYVDGGYYENVWVEPVYRTEIVYGVPRTVIVTPGYYHRVYRVRSSPSFGIHFHDRYRHHHHHHSRRDRDNRDRDGYHYRDKPGRYR